MPYDTLYDARGHNDSDHSREGVPPEILVVDDSRVVRAYLCSLFRAAGYAVAEAQDKSEAMEMLSDDTGAVLVDLWMGGMDVLRHIREHYPCIPVIMITAIREVAHAVEAMKNGAFYYVTKPFDPDEMLSLVEQAIAQRLQSIRVHRDEGRPGMAGEHESAIAGHIRKSLLLPDLPRELCGIQIGDLNISSRDIDGDFYDCFAPDNSCIDLFMGDVMGKGVQAALVGAEAKRRFMSILYRLARPSGIRSLPAPERIVSLVHKEMIARLEEQETFFTLCYARFDMHRLLLSYVDCGHMRTIHVHYEAKTATLLQGVDMPIGFPGQDSFTQILVPFSPGDLFFFYSDGITEAPDASGKVYGEDRLVHFIRDNAYLQPQALCETTLKEIVDYTGTRVFGDDFTCVAMKVAPSLTDTQSRSPEWSLSIRSDMEELGRLRDFIEEICRGLGKSIDTERIKMIQIVATEITTNIIRHAYADTQGRDILVEASATPEEIVLSFYDWGIEFDFSTAPSPVFDGSREDGFGLHIIAHTADYVRYGRDEDGRNCACVTFLLNKRGS